VVSYSMSYAPVDSVLEEMGNAYNTIRGVIDDVNTTQMTQLNIDTWRGDSHTDYSVQQTNWNNACDDLNNVLQYAQKTLNAMKENIMATDSKVAGMFQH
jgi:WXG100 family type VII secretion target